MKVLEVRSAIRRATKEDLFTGDVYNMRSQQGVKNNVTVFYLDQNTKQIYGPRTIFEYSDFTDLYIRMQLGLVGIITYLPNVVTNEFLFDLVLREALMDDMKDTPCHIKLNRMFYTYCDQKLLGPFYTDNSTTSEALEKMLSKKQLFVANERQHFKLKKTA
jgi:hypothetical protein